MRSGRRRAYERTCPSASELCASGECTAALMDAAKGVGAGVDGAVLRRGVSVGRARGCLCGCCRRLLLLCGLLLVVGVAAETLLCLTLFGLGVEADASADAMVFARVGSVILLVDRCLTVGGKLWPMPSTRRDALSKNP